VHMCMCTGSGVLMTMCVAGAIKAKQRERVCV